MSVTLHTLGEKWMAAKAIEVEAIAARRAIEDDMLEEIAINETEEGTHTRKSGDLTIKIVNRMNRKVDGDKLQLLAVENGITYEVLQQLFRWKPELAMREWKSADDAVKTALQDAITTTPGRPSVSIERE